MKRMRHFLFGLIAVVLGFGALAATSAPAQAQGFSISVGEPYGRPQERRWHRRYGRPVAFRPVSPYRTYQRYERPRYERPVAFRPAPVYRPYARPAYYAGPRCTVRTMRQWNGYGWELQRREVCR